MLKQINPLVKDGSLGKYVFLYDYATTIYTPEAEAIIQNSDDGTPINLPKDSFYDLKYSKGDVVDVIGFKKTMNEKGVPNIDRNILVIEVPKYVKPITLSPSQSQINISEIDLNKKSFAPAIFVDNSTLGWLQKVVDATPLTQKLGVGFGKNLNPKSKPKIDEDVIVIKNGVEDVESKSFLGDKNNLLLIGGILLLGFLLLNNKSE
jgi:hypothetical protein